LIVFNRAIGNRTLLLMARLVSMAAFIGLISFAILQNDLSKSIFISLTISMILLWLIYLLNYRFQAHYSETNEQQMKEHIFRVLNTLVPIVESKSQTTRYEITEMSVLMKKVIHKLPEIEVKEWEIELLSLLHYVSRIQWPEYLFEKREKLTEYEFKVVQNHPMLGYQLLGDFKALENVKEAFLKHHEKTDGTGYPHELDGRNIPKLAQVLGIVECFLAMIKPRAYRRSLSIEEALLELKEFNTDGIYQEVLDSLINVVKESYERSYTGEMLVTNSDIV
jgi:HD-GYP domain-containing protein (c-di-GMP phosphodiesterase class II)